MMWWYQTKLSQSGTWMLTSGAGSKSGLATNQHNTQYSCASLCDEIVGQWRIAALNPRLTRDERMQLKDHLRLYHRRAAERIWKLISAVSGGSSRRSLYFDSYISGRALSRLIEIRARSSMNAKFLQVELNRERTARGRASILPPVCRPSRASSGPTASCRPILPDSDSTGSPASSWDSKRAGWTGGTRTWKASISPRRLRR